MPTFSPLFSVSPAWSLVQSVRLLSFESEGVVWLRRNGESKGWVGAKTESELECVVAVTSPWSLLLI